MATRIVRLLVTGILVVYSARLVWGRGALFVRTWRDASRTYERASRQHAECSRNHDMLHTWADECHAADLAIEEWPMTRAWTTLLENTYLCVEVPCAVLFGSFFDSWSTRFALCIVVLIVVPVVSCVPKTTWNFKRKKTPHDTSGKTVFLAPPSPRVPLALLASSSHNDGTSWMTPTWTRRQHEPVV